MTALKRHALTWISEAIDPDLPGLRQVFALSVPQSHALVNHLLATGKDRIISHLIPLVFDLLEEEGR